MDKLIEKDLLYDLYVNQKLSARTISKIVHKRSSFVSECINYYGFPKLERKRKNKADEKTISEWINLYINENKSSTEIAKLYNTTHKTVLDTLKENGIKRRSLTDAQRAKANKNPYVDELNNYEIMNNLYTVQKMTLNDIGYIFDCAPFVVRRKLVQLNIPIRSQSEVKIGLLVGEDHPNWKGGVTPLYSRLREFFDTNQSPEIRKRDNYTCQLCGSHSNLHVHHIKPFVEIVDEIINEHKDLNPVDNINELYDICVSDPRMLDESNLITYCKNCHFYKIHKFNKTISSEASKEERSTTIP